MNRKLACLAVLAAACNGSAPLSDGAAPRDLAAPASSDAALLHDGGSDGAPGCPRLPGPADRARKVVVSHPFDGQGGKDDRFEVLDLSPSGALSRGGVTFHMGMASQRPIRFTPDGEVGLVAQDDGSLGVFRLDGAGAPQVIHAALRDGFYAEDVLVDEQGVRAWVIDADTAENGGGLYRFDIGCDGTLTSRGRVAAGSGAFAMGLVPGGARAVLSAASVLGSPGGDDTHLLALDGNAPALAASGDVFGDGAAIASSIAVTPDGRFALVTDDGIAAGSRMAVVSLPALARVQLLSLPNPAQVVVSPFGNAALVLDSDGKDALRLLRYDAKSAQAPFTVVGEIAYRNGRPMLPSSAAVIARGPLEGLVLIAENAAVREVQLGAAGDAADVALQGFGGELSDVVGVVGVQP